MDEDELEIADDDDDDDVNEQMTDNQRAPGIDTDVLSCDDDCTDEDEHIDTTNSMNSMKEDFSGMKVINSVQSHVEHAYFKVLINNRVKFVHKQTACWLLTSDKSKTSSDRLLRVRQANEDNS